MRVSDADRERVLRTLRDGVVDGRLSHDTFVRRVERTLAARSDAELAGLTDDLPHRPHTSRGLGRSAVLEFGAVVERVVFGLSAASWQLQRAWRAPRLPRLTLPPVDDPRSHLVGRARDCDVVLDDPSVSRHHARLRPGTDGWELCDLGSTNGTAVNRRRVRNTSAVRPGDLVTFGRLTLSVVGPVDVGSERR